VQGLAGRTRVLEDVGHVKAPLVRLLAVPVAQRLRKPLSRDLKAILTNLEPSQFVEHQLQQDV
jgi:hypothetical protein